MRRGAGLRNRISLNGGTKVAAVVLSLVGAPAIAAEAGQTKGGTAAKKEAAAQDLATRSIMDTIFAPMATILPLSFDNAAFSAPANRPVIIEQTRRLVTNVDALERHAAAQDRAFEFVAKSLQRDVRNLARWYERGMYDEARFTLHNLTENCIACHASLPEERKFPPVDSFFASIKLDRLPPLEQAHMLVMSRQFDKALVTYEELFKGKELHPMNLVILGSFVDYLRVCVHVKSDLKRPQATLVSIKDRAVTPLHVKTQLDQWLKTLRDLEARRVLAKPNLDEARRILAQGRALMEYPRDRDGLMHHLVASAILTRYIHERPDRGRDVAEAYYLLGLADAALEHSLWIQRSDFYFESAIRLAPGADFAPKAYAAFEESMISNYSGSRGTDLPVDARGLLLELRRLVEEARGKKS